ncbi:type 1 glutamine amidotransferase domain-containing protein [Corynebacterium sp. MSK041]|uniref:type 1 glutamine amidotransferase domain-containing protein n=1 Tax=Corynebacterium sp. MSK041 TaxID=3050194 RepID=UPI00254E6A5E|nr:type 1 glutamine amidotransferase domain-containing protein [Corynebacterium sp. MSK041]MDK8795012.1 type 1 glutamine amidotransferase domain-containing protein [Corynebacterium sp. MSK041]
MSENTLQNKKVAILSTNGFEDSELTGPREAVEAAGATAVVVAPEAGTIEGKKGANVDVDLTTAEANAADFDALILPGGTGNADHIRMDEAAVAFVRELTQAGKPVGVICHGGWILTDADALRGVRMTSYPSLKTDLKNAGAEWVDEEVVADKRIISSRTPDDLPAFNKAIVEEFAK